MDTCIWGGSWGGCWCLGEVDLVLSSFVPGKLGEAFHIRERARPVVVDRDLGDEEPVEIGCSRTVRETQRESRLAHGVACI